MEKSWVESIRRQCERAGVPFFFKQWGGVQKSRNGRELNSRTYDALPSRIVSPILDRETRTALVADVERGGARWSDEPIANIVRRPRSSISFDAAE
jgi:Protein of unknown function (DUF5131)